jgi:hypothetical protein
LTISEPVRAAPVVDQAARRIWSLVPTRWGALALFALSLGVYALEALAWPVAVTFGRDSHEYLVYYLDFFHATPLFPQVMLAHTPIAPFVLGILFEGGPRLVEAGLAVAYAASIVAYAAAAARFSTLSAVLTAGALLAWPSYGSLFHQVDSDGLFALGFALWVLVVVRTAQKPSTIGFALNGLVLAALVLVRPSSQLLFLFALFPLFLGFPWWTRLRWSGAFVVAAALPLILWAGINLARYDGFTLSRYGRANIPFWRVLMINHMVRPENGPASRELVAAIQRDLLNREPYRSYDIDLERFLGRPPWIAWWDLVALSDRTWGWSTDGRKLFSVAIEAIRRHPGTYAHGVGRTIWSFLDNRYLTYFDTNTAGSLTGTQGSDEVVVDGRRLPARIVAPAIGFTAASRPDGRVLADWRSITRPRIRFDDPALNERLASFTETLRRWEQPPREPSARVANWLNFELERRYPRRWLWLLIAVAALAIRRPKGVAPLITMTLLGLALTAFYALSFPAIPQFVLPVAPAFVLLAVVALTSRRRETPSGSA